MQHKHGAYYFVRGGKWYPLGREYGIALVKYAELVGRPQHVRTVKDAVWAYIEHAKTRTHKKPASEATLTGYRYSAANLCAVFGPLGLGEIKPAMVSRYIIEGGTVQHQRDKALLSAAYTYAITTGAYEGMDPTKRLGVRHQEKPRSRYVEDGELDALLTAASAKVACMAEFIALTAMRQGDALRVKLADLGPEGITFDAGKTGKRTVVLWSPELRACVDRAHALWPKASRVYLFESHPKGRHARRGPGPYTPSGLRALWRVARKRAGLSDIRLHDLRAKAGSDRDTLTGAQELLGHADAKVTARHYRRKPARVQPSRLIRKPGIVETAGDSGEEIASK
jgi:integrase